MRRASPEPATESSPEPAASSYRSGFRLHRFEVLNWGTFGKRVWRLEPAGESALLTGDIGSGKSTLVDALTTLLVPHHRIVYNKAAGADGKERSLYSYIRGEYKSTKDELTQSARAVYARDENTYTVLLACFENEGFEQRVTLAQVFWLKDGQRNPERFFVVSDRPLTIAEHFMGFGADIQELKRRLKKLERVTVKSSFQEYSTLFRRLFGIQHEQALDLFYQTVSMKSVGSLTEFVRDHMLEPANVEERLDDLRKNFDNLRRAHEAVLKAKRQIDLLTPIDEGAARLDELQASYERLRKCRELLSAWVADRKAELLDQRIERLEDDARRADKRLQATKAELETLQDREKELRLDIERSGGGRLQAIESQIVDLGKARDRAREAEGRYRDLARPLGLTVPTGADGFDRNRRAAEKQQRDSEQAREDNRKGHVDRSIERRQLAAEAQAIETELESLRARRSNIPLLNLHIRKDLAEAIGVAETELPFAGELLRVADKESAWEGAIERVLRNFGLSVLVPEGLYQPVAHYVDQQRLQGKLVYFRVREGDARSPKPLDRNALPRKVQVHPDTPFRSWLEAELAERFNHVCCDDMETFRRQPKAMTQAGQIKAGGARHEKDDRHPIHDRSRYVLGWDNADKIRALEKNLDRLRKSIAKIDGQLQALENEGKRLSDRRDNAIKLLEAFRDHVVIDWQGPARLIEDLEAERRAIEEGSDVLRRLKLALEETKEAIRAKDGEREEATKSGAELRERLAVAQKQRESALEEVERHAVEVRSEWFPRIAEYRAALSDAAVTLQNVDKTERETREHLQGLIDKEQKQNNTQRDKLLESIRALKHEHPAETAEIDTSVDAVPELRAMLAQLRAEDLPRHEARFKELLNERTIQSVVLFQSQLERERKAIEEKIAAINRSLKAIEYNPGTFIELVADASQDKEINDFRHDLRQCLANSLDEQNLYNEERFFQVKAILDRFNGREGSVELDRRWTTKVTDVRSWFNFSASERWREDGTEKEFYPGSSGKSGGQKEKLAYTILASALAYQFGLEWNDARSRSFRFVIIDEAFGRGSDPSTRYGLELFEKLSLQLFIVTPLQKIHVIEDHVSSVHFVHNAEGKDSVVRSLTIEEYRADKLRLARPAERRPASSLDDALAP